MFEEKTRGWDTPTCGGWWDSCKCEHAVHACMHVLLTLWCARLAPLPPPIHRVAGGRSPLPRTSSDEKE